MREPPTTITNDSICVALHDHYGLAAADLTFLPLGHDSSAWVYRLDTEEGASYFLKVRLSVTNQTALLVPRYLQDHGVAHVIAPLPTSSHALWATVQNHALILYPFVAGATGMEQPMLAQQWREYGAILRQIHETPIAPELARQLRRETFTPDGAPKVRRLLAFFDGPRPDEPVAQELADFWMPHRNDIRMLLNRGEELGRRLAQSTPPLLLCHADIHTNNLLLDAEQRVWVVDWDETMLAPRERDLMFAVGGISAALVRPHEEALFREGYGPIAIDPLALAYYRYAWALGDIGDFGDQVCFRSDLGEFTRREALRYCTGLFKPGEIVEIALNSAYPAA